MRVRDLSTPRQRRRVGIHYDQDAFGQFSEAIARRLGTARFLVLQSVIVFVWILLNVFIEEWRFDKYPFILLTLALSLQAAYAAPLILLAQNRQEDRDREQLEVDRAVAARTQAETEYLARELAGVRLALNDVVTTEDLKNHLEELTDAITRLTEQFDNGSQQRQRPSA
ncbi:MAG: hypothetical protein RL419_455 [Actinomycetota bacterium]|jgi:uncharacterized membrane protein